MNAEPIENLHFAIAADKIGAGLEEQWSDVNKVDRKKLRTR